MLNLPISGVETVIFFIFLLIWAGSLFGGFIFGKLNQEETRRMPIATRLLSSFTLLTTAWAWFAIAQGTPVDRFALWVAIGMTFGFIGDVIMAEIFSLQNYVIYGMLAFGLGHIAYIIGMLMVILSIQLRPSSIFGIMLIWWLIALALWYLVIYRNSKRSILIYLALPYALLLASTVAFAINLTILDKTFFFVIVGAVLFLISDLILAAQLFNRLHFKYISDIVWLTYGPGQMLIVFGVIIYTMIDRLPFFP